MTRRRCFLGLVVLAGLTGADAAAQYPGYGGPQVGGYGGYPGGYGGTGYGGYGGLPIYPFGAGGGGLGGFGVTSSSPFAPNYYNRQTQPLSPYLNLFRNNPAVNYFYGVRPGLPSGQPIGQGFGSSVVGPSQLQAGFVPYIAGNPNDEPQEIPAAGPAVRIPSGAHAVVYGSRFGPLSGMANRGRAGPSGVATGMGMGSGGMNSRSFTAQPMQTGSGGRASPTIPPSR